MRGVATRAGQGGPVPVRAVLAADRQRLEQLVEDAGQLLLRATLLAVAVRGEDRLPITALRLEELTHALREAVEDGRAAARAWKAGR